jgi:hypothetical protein
MPSVNRKLKITLLREELSFCLKERETSPGGQAFCNGSHAEELPIIAVLKFLRGECDMTELSPGDILEFGCYCHLDFYRLLSLVIKGEWEWYISQRLHFGEHLEDVVDEGLGKVRELSSGFSLTMERGADGVGLYQLFELHGHLASNRGYDENDFRDLVSHLILADVHLFAGSSPELANFVSGEVAQRAVLKGVSSDAADEFWKKKRVWIELENEVEVLLLKLEEQTLRNRKVHKRWMATFGKIYIPLLESEYCFSSFTYRIRCKEEDPLLTLEDLEVLEEENRQVEEAHLERLKKNARVIRKDLPGPGGIPLDYEEMEDYEKECKKLLRKIWRLTHPDAIDREKFTTDQKKKLRSYFEEAVPFQDGGSLEDEEIALTMRSLLALQDLLSKVEAVWKSMGLDFNEHAVIRGESLAEQVAWLDWRINVLEEEAGQVRAEIIAAVNDPESLEMEACLASPEQINRISEEMLAKLRWYDEQLPLLKGKLWELFEREDFA